MDCLFCKIIAGNIPANIVYRDDSVVAFEDVHPKAPHHILIIPQKHIATLNEIDREDKELIGHIVETGMMLAKKLNIAENGYRLVANCNKAAGQTVFHLHFHLLGGRDLSWPPG